MKTEHTSISTVDGDFSSYVARPDAASAPAVVVIQEIFGVNGFVREVADGLAAQGYLAICPDLFWRIEPGVDLTEADRAKAFELYGKFDVAMGVHDIQATIAHVRADPQCSGKVGAVGFCLGGLLAFLTAARTDIDAAVGYYGVGIQDRADEAGALNRPLMLHIAEEDGFVPMAAQEQIKAMLAGKPDVTLHSYPGRDHAFARTGGHAYDAADAQIAGERTLAFFAKHLR